jgi:hypothetical protein
MATSGFQYFKGSSSKLALIGGFLVIMADFAMAMFNPALWTVPWSIICTSGYIGVMLTIPFLIWLFKRLS